MIRMSRRAALRGAIGGAAATVLPAGVAAAAAPVTGPIPGFMLFRGRLITFEPDDPQVRTLVADVNNAAEMSGEYLYPGKESALYRDARGRFRPFDVPGALGTEAIKINSSGQIAGSYSERTPIVNDDPRSRAYRWDRGRVVRIDYPGAQFTAATGVNDHGVVCGQFLDGAGVAHGFVWKEGRFTVLDPPSSAGTAPLDLNNRGEVVGVYVTAAGSVRGFRYRTGRFADVTVLDSVTVPWGINNLGQIVGHYGPTARIADARGFLLASGINGPVTRIDVPEAPYTAAFGISDNGRIVGNFVNPDAAPGALAALAGSVNPVLGRMISA